jgi:acetyl-CoA acetyltransferase family protein
MEMQEAVIVDAIRTPLGKRDKGLRDVHPMDLLAGLFQELVKRNNLDPERIDDVIGGCVMQVGEQGGNIARLAWLSAGLPESVPGTSVDRQCGSSLQAAHFAAQGVMAGVYDLAIACGVESMTRVPMGASMQNGPGMPITESLSKRYNFAERGFFNQGLGAEMIAREYGLNREALDRFSLESHRRAAAAWEQGAFNNEVVPVKTPEGLVSKDEGFRADSSYEKIASLKPAFSAEGVITAGNSSQITDGASAALIASRKTAEKLGLKPRARMVSMALAGVDPVTMLKGPIPATRKAMAKAGLDVGDIDLFEVNEAFAPVVMAWQKDIGAPADKTNVNGGAIAIGHPLGATGTRIIATLLNALEQRNGRYGLIAICEGGGMANATIIERLG